MVKLPIRLREEEYRALVASATFDRRDPRDQASLLLAAQLEKLGLLKPANTPEAAKCPGD